MLNKIKIGPKLIGGFVIVLLVMAALVGFNYTSLADLRKMQDEGAIRAKSALTVADMRRMGYKLYKVVADLEINRDVQASQAAWAKAKNEALTFAGNLDKAVDTDAEKAEMEKADKALTRYFDLVEKEMFPLFAGALDQKKEERMRELDARIDATLEELQVPIRVMTASINKESEEADDVFDADIENITRISLFLAAIALIVSLLIGILLSRSITKPLGRAVAMIQELGKGHLGLRLKLDSRDEIGVMAATMDAFADDLQNNIVAAVKKIGEGDLSSDLAPKDNQDEITPALNNTIGALRALIAEVAMLSQAAVEGKLATRGKTDRFKGGYRDIVQGVNDTLDSVIGPLNVAAKYVDDISKGTIPPKITDAYNGDFNAIKVNLNQCIDAVNNLVADAAMLSKAAVEGKLATRADASKHWGDFRKIVQGVDDTLDAVIGPLNVAAKYVDEISKGNLPPKITDSYNGDFNTIKINLNQCIDAVNNLVTDANMLSQAAVEGKLATRADAAKHHGDYRRIVAGVNDTLDSVVGFLDSMPAPAMIIDKDFNIRYMNKTGASLGGKDQKQLIGTKCYDFFKTGDCRTGTCACGRAIASGQINNSETDAHPSGLNLDIAYTGVPIKDKTGAVIGAFEVVTDLTAIRKAQRLADKVSTYQAVEVQKITRCLSQLSNGDLGFTAQVEQGDSETQTTRETFAAITGGLNECKSAIEKLVADAAMLSTAAVEGKLATRADASKHTGDFRRIVAGVNETLDAVIGPLNVAADYVDKISKGNIPPRITDTYNGDFNTIKNNLNTCIDAVNALVADAKMLSAAAVEGKLATRADAGKHQGDFRKIVQGVDDCLDAVIGPLNVAATYVEEISKGNPPPKITDTYNGDFNTIKNNLNQCIDAVKLLVTDANMLAQAGVDGRLATRADAARHNGDFRMIVDGVNMTLDAVIIPINEAQSVMEKVAGRDMTARVKGSYKGDLDKIKKAINTAVDNLDQALQQVAEGTAQVSSAGQQISAGSQSLAQGANEQASSLEEVSSSLEEMASMTKQNAENANQAKNLSAEANTNAAQGTEAMNRMSSSINKIKESSDQTAKIVKTIDEIAMQTNLLALNAAVEAARAGEAGRGFAVVAEEVRNLAQRSAQAAKNTADMITESVKNAEEGVKISTEVAKSFDAIAGSAKKVNDLIAEIAAASGEQSQGIDQVNNAVAQMDKVTQQNAANSEESASAAEELSSQAEELQTMVAQFALSYASSKTTVQATAAAQTRMATPQVRVRGATSLVASKKNGNGKKYSPHVLKKQAEEIIPMDDEVLKEF
jgi:methyl-accepting chemotaxis protein